MSTLEAYVGYKEKLAKKSVGRLGEMIIGEKAVDPVNMSLRQFFLPGVGAAFGARGSRGAEALAGLGGGMLLGPGLGSGLGGALVGHEIATAQRKKLADRLLGAGVLAGGATAYAALKNKNKSKK